jgi:MFS family permease
VRLTDQYGRKALYVATLAVSAFLVAMQGFAPTLATLAILRTVAFAASNGMAPIVFAYTVEAAPARYRGLFCGALSIGYPLGWFGAALIAAPLLAHHGWRMMFLPALIVIPLAFFLGRRLPESKREVAASGSAVQSTFAERFRELWSPELRRRTLLCSAASFLNGGAYAGTAFFFPTFYHEFRGYSESDAAYIVGLGHGIAVFGYLSAAVVGEFVLTRRNTIVTWFWIGSTFLLGVIWFSHSFTMDVLFYAVMACFLYGSQAVMATFNTEIFPTRVRATALGVSSSFATYLGFAIFPLIVPQVIELVGWQWAFTICSVPAFYLAGAAILGLPNFKSGMDVDAIEASTRSAAMKPSTATR